MSQPWLFLAALALSVPTSGRHQTEPPKLTGSLLVANQKDDSAYLIRLRDGHVARRFQTGHGPHEAATSPSGKLGVISNYLDPVPSLLVIDIAAGKPLRTIPLGEYSRPHGVLFVDEDHVINTSETTKKLVLTNVKTGKVERALDTGQPGSHMFVLGKGGKFAYSANIGSSSVSKINVATGKVVAEAPVGKGSEGIGISPDGKTVWTGNRGEGTVTAVDTETMKATGTASAPGLPYRVAFSPNGKWALIANPGLGTLDVFDAAKREKINGIDASKGKVTFDALGGPPAIGGLAVHPGGRYVFCTVINAAAVAVVDLEKGEVVAKYEAATSPDGIAYSRVEPPKDDSGSLQMSMASPGTSG